MSHASSRTHIHTLFAYGALMHGERLHGSLSGRVFLGGGTTSGRLVDVEGAAGLDPDGTGRVHGELYLVDDETLSALDAAEGTRFLRLRVVVRAGNDGPEVSAWAWACAAPSGLPEIQGGRWASPGRRWKGGTLWYFAYASNMWRMAERRKLDVVEQRRGRIDNYRIASVTDSGDGKNAYGHILPRRGAVVEGMLYRLPEEQTATDFDVQEKVGIRMQRRTFAATDERGARLLCEVYIALPEKMVWGRPQHPDNAVKILDGARDCDLPPDYIGWLADFLKKPADPSDYDSREAW